jgi:hypothetical protein
MLLEVMENARVNQDDESRRCESAVTSQVALRYPRGLSGRMAQLVEAA